MSTRALTQVEAERVRDRIVELLVGRTEQEVGDFLGISQQMTGKIKNRQQTPGYHVARKIAAYDRVPVEVLLDGVPAELYRALGARRWPDHVVAAISKLSLTMPRSRAYTLDDWNDVLRRAEEALQEIGKSGPRMGR